MTTRVAIALLALALTAPVTYGGTITGITATQVNGPQLVGEQTTGPDESVWFAAWKENAIGRIAPDRSVRYFPLPVENSVPVAITTGLDGNIWFTEQAGRIGRLTAAGAIIEVPVANNDFLNNIVTGADGSLWFLDQPAQHGPTRPDVRLGRIGVDHAITTYDLGSADNFAAMISGPDGNLWINDQTTNKLVKFSRKTATIQATYPLPPATGDAQLNHFVLAPDGNLWMTHGNAVDRIRGDGTVTEYAVPTANAVASGLAVGFDGNLWFTEYHGGKVGQLVLSSATDGGQATINESAAILGDNSADLVELSGPRPPATASTGKVRPLDEIDPCLIHSWLTRKTDENGDLFWLALTSPQDSCADVVSFGSIAARDLTSRTHIPVYQVTVGCGGRNDGPSTADQFHVVCTSRTGTIDVAHGTVQGACTFTPINNGVDLTAKELDSGQVCGFQAPFLPSETDLNILVVNAYSSTFDPRERNNFTMDDLAVEDGKVHLHNLPATISLPGRHFAP